MVIFTCNHCGESLQKPRVEKHYATQCRNLKFVTCVDCFKDFRGEEYATHFKCITEEERYAAKGSIPPGGIVKKGEVKQESWMDMIKSIVEKETSLVPAHRNLLNTISNYTNVPRKKVKFINFLKNSTGGRVRPADIEAVWDLIEKYKETKTAEKRKLEVNGQDSPQNKKSKVDNGTDSAQEKEDADNSTTLPKDLELKGKKAKKNKRKLETGEKCETDSGIEKQEESCKSKNKLKKNVKSTAEELALINGSSIEESQINQIAKKKSKKSKVTDSQTQQIEVEVANREKKSKKSNKVVNLAEQEMKQDVKNSEIDPSKNEKIDSVIEKSEESSKSKDKLKKNVQSTDPTNGSNIEESEINQTAKKKSKKSKVADSQTKQIEVEAANRERKSKKTNQVVDLAEQEMKQDVKNSGTDTFEKCNGHNLEEKKSKVVEDVKNNGVQEQAPSDTVSPKKNASFDFKSKIMDVITNKKQISCKKLEKKVLKAYLAETGELECGEKIVKKYNKQLNKLDNVLVNDGFVTIVDNEC